MLTKISAFSRQRKKNKYTELQKQEVFSKPESDYIQDLTVQRSCL